jgi:hypothetical protein
MSGSVGGACLSVHKPGWHRAFVFHLNFASRLAVEIIFDEIAKPIARVARPHPKPTGSVTSETVTSIRF